MPRSVTSWAMVVAAVVCFTPRFLFAQAPAQFLQLVPVVGGLPNLVGVVDPGDGRLFLVQQHGVIRIWNGQQVLSPAFLDISSAVTDCTNGCGERGLLGLAFHPDYATNHQFYVYYTRRSDGDIVIARYLASQGNPDLADAGSASMVLMIEHSAAGNHNGGHLAFDADGLLYAGVGDGGGGGDPFESGQSTTTMLGKILRIDVDSDDFPSDPNRNYGIPSENPFAGATPGTDEIWDFGLRNPWRFSFDRQTGDLFVGDVGQNMWEEVDLHPASQPGGVNFGWDCREGAHPYTDDNGDMNAGCGSVVSQDPILEYSHSLGCSITGGYVFRGRPVSALLSGNYLYGDFCSGRIWRGIRGSGGGWSASELPVPASFGLSSFGESASGRIYVAYIDGTLRWLAPHTFQDVPPSRWSWPFVEAIADSGLTAGCGAGPTFCPTQALTRAEAAVMLVRALHGREFTPPPATGTVFEDVSAATFGAPFIEQLFADGLTAGCASNPRRYCPGSQVTRAEMAVFLLHLAHGGGYTPPPGAGTVFADVPVSHWAVGWVEQLFAEGLTGGCATSPLRFCPGSQTSREEMAAFLSSTLALPLP